MTSTDKHVSLDWQPPHTVKTSKRAMHLQLKITPDAGLIVVIPEAMKDVDVDAFLIKHRKWIDKKLLLIPTNNALPEKFQLRSLKQTWKVEYLATSSRLQLFTNRDNTITLMGKIDNQKKCDELLNKWLRGQGMQYLLPLLESISEEIGLSFSEASIQNHTSRWGSCSIDREINLNQRLLFLAPELVRYVIIHELCHTKIMSHSPKFWNLVGRFDPNFDAHRKELNFMSQSMNAWGKLPEYTGAGS